MIPCKTNVQLLLVVCSLTVMGCADVVRQGDDPTQETRQIAIDWIDGHQKDIIDLSDTLWGYAELPFEEFRSYLRLTEELRNAGFTLQEHVGGLPTAFVASFSHGSGKPAIGIVAEFDVPPIPGLSQKAGVPFRAELVSGGYGHGCGHNMIGASSAGSAMALKEAMVKANLSGTIKFFGTPAEEGVTGKIYMADAGVFNDLDVALAWHPGPDFEARYGFNNAKAYTKFVFKGETQDDALKAALAFQENGSQVSVIVTGTEAQVKMSITAPTREEVDKRMEEVRMEASRLASETGTNVQELFVVGAYQRLPNEHLVMLMDETMGQFVPLSYSEEEEAFARQIASTFTKTPNRDNLMPQLMPPSKNVGGANDNADVSWLTPFISVRGGTYVNGITEHSWQQTSMSASSIGHKGMLAMSKVVSVAALDLLTRPGLLADVRKEFTEKTKGFVYKANLPQDRNWRIVRR